MGFNITGDGGGRWTVDMVSKPPTCTAGDTGKAQCAVELDVADFQAMVANPMLGVELYSQGKLRVTGNAVLLTKLQTLFAMVNK